MLIEILYHFLTLDLAWIIDFLLANALWVFVFAAAAFFYFEKKNWVWTTVFVSFMSLVYVEFANVVGWTVLSKEFWGLNMVVTMAVLMFAETDSWGKKNLILVNTLRFIFVFAFYNLFLV